MNWKSKGFVFAMAVLALALGVALAGAQAQAGTAQQAPAQAAAETPKPKVTEEVFKNIQVLKGVPFRWTIARPNGRFTIQLEQVQQNVLIDDARFAAPAAPAPTEQKPPTL